MNRKTIATAILAAQIALILLRALQVPSGAIAQVCLAGSSCSTVIVQPAQD